VSVSRTSSDVKLTLYEPILNCLLFVRYHNGMKQEFDRSCAARN